MNEDKKYCYKYPHPSVTTDCIVFGFDGKNLRVLLIRRGLEPYLDAWALPGGFLRMDETAEECALRELYEETHFKTAYMTQLGAFSKVDRDPRERVITIAFFALVRLSEVSGGDDASEARWFALDKLPELAFDHDYILKEALKALRKMIKVEPIAFGLLDEKFTIPELHSVYEALEGKRLDRRNFSRKMLSENMIEMTDEKVENTRYRAPQLYRANPDVMNECSSIVSEDDCANLDIKEDKKKKRLPRFDV